ncbi:MAG: hypothetical protein FWC14_07145 [Candidatus Bathyarchaeota archaeon]|uniref:hypothetical protein n=1 Tax=Candidatus Bathycorpusculum sp. TaxID=2994959 RepID=UPI002827969B|nr:hypothetical protein [Candidatus Termiticorpusculum sp.]
MGSGGLFVLQKKVDLFGCEVFVYVVLDPECKGREMKRLILQSADEKARWLGLEYAFLWCGVMVLVFSFEIVLGDVAR